MSTDTPSDWQPDFAGVSQNPPAWAAKRPLRIAVLGDFGAGALNGRLDTGAALARRKPMKVEFDTLDAALERVQLKLMLPLGAGGTPVEVDIGELEALHPDELYRHVAVFAALASLRKRLNTPATFAAAAAEVAGWAGDDSRSASSLARQGTARGAAPARGATLDDFARLTGRASSAGQAESSIDDMLRRIVGPFVVAAASPKKEALLASVDQALTDAMRAVLHQGDFQNTESLWRGVDFLLRRLETSHRLQVHLFDISAEELAADLSGAPDLADTGLYKLLVEQPAQDADGGYTYLAGLYHFEATPPHAELLGRAARVAAHAGAPFITALNTAPFADRREPPHRLVTQAFSALREMSDASFLALMGPRFLLRHPYGKRSDPIQSFAFEEFSREAGLRGMLWGHPALLALTVLGTPGAQLTIDDLPFHHITDADGDSIALPCTDRLVNTNTATLLRDVGINALMAHKGEALVRLSGLEAVNGDGLADAASAGAGRRASDSRVSVGSKGAALAGPTWTAPTRQAGAATASALAAAAPAEANKEADTDTNLAGDGAAGAPAEMGAEANADDELAALLAGLETPEPAADADTAAEAEAPSADDELAALLASLDAPAEPAAAAAGEEAADPDLEALLKSLG